MAASVRVARVTGASQPIYSTGTGTSNLRNGVVVRIAGVTASSGASSPSVRIAAVTAVGGAGAPASVRVATIDAYALQATYVWDGAEWLPTAEPPVVLSTGTGTSSVTGTVTYTATVTSTGTGTSTIVGFETHSISLALSGGGTLTPSAANLGPGDKTFTINLTGGGTLTLSASANIGPPGAGSLTVVPQPGNTPPRILIDLTGALGTVTTITRIDRAGNRAPVRLANPEALNGGEAIVYDYEAPYNQTVHYEAATAGPTIVSDPVTLTADGPWLVHPGIPSLSLPLEVESYGDRTRSTSQGVFVVQGRRDPLVITDGVRHSATFDLVVHTKDYNDEAAMDALLDDSSPLLLQIVYPNTTRTVYRWVAVGDAQASDVVPVFESPYVRWTLPCTSTTAPAGLQQAQFTWADLRAAYPTWADVKASFATWRDVITDSPMGS